MVDSTTTSGRQFSEIAPIVESPNLPLRLPTPLPRLGGYVYASALTILDFEHWIDDAIPFESPSKSHNISTPPEHSAPDGDLV